jgi:hypothetical protein
MLTYRKVPFCTLPQECSPLRGAPQRELVTARREGLPATGWDSPRRAALCPDSVSRVKEACQSPTSVVLPLL